MTLFDWLGANAMATFFVGLAVNVFLIFAVVAFFQGRTIELWPPKIGPKTDHPRQRVLVDTVPLPKAGHANFWDGSYLLSRDVDVPVRFRVPFQHKPDVVVSLHMLDAGIYMKTPCREGDCVPVVRVKVEARNVTEEGFDLRFETWNESLLWNAMAAWVAVGS